MANLFPQMHVTYTHPGVRWHSAEHIGHAAVLWTSFSLLVSEPGFSKVLGDFGRQFKLISKLRPRSNIVE